MPILTTRKSTISITGMFFLCAVVLCMGAALVAYRAVSDLESRTQELLKANAVLLHLEQAQAHLHNLVANARSYALSARQESLLSVERERSALFDRLDGLRGLLRDQPQQLDQLAALNAAIVKRIEQARIMMDAGVRSLAISMNMGVILVTASASRLRSSSPGSSKCRRALRRLSNPVSKR